MASQPSRHEACQLALRGLCGPGPGMLSFLKRAAAELSADCGSKHFCSRALGCEPFKTAQAAWQQRRGTTVKRATRGACSLSVRVFMQDAHVGRDL